MGVWRPLARKREIWRKPATNPDCRAFPRYLVQVAKLRARKPISVPLNTRIWPRKTDTEDVHVQTIAPLRPTPFPPHPEEPLIEPEHWRHLPSKLARPEMPAVKAENVALAQPGYEGLTPKHVRSGWSHTGYKVLGMYRKLYLDPPKTGIGEGYNLLLTDSGLANCATHIFAVYAYAPPSAVPDPAARRHKCPRWRREVCIYPTHAAIWAAYCARLPPMPKKPTKLKVIADPRPGGRRAYVLRLPMVPVAVPYPPMFFPVMQFVYTYRKSSFVNLLLPCADFVLPPDNFHDPPPEQTIPRYAQALAESFELRTLCRYAKNVHGAYRNMVALGVVEDRMWDALDYAWQTILTAMDLSEKATAARQASDET